MQHMRDIIRLGKNNRERGSMVREGVFVACAALIAASILVAGYLVTTTCGCENLTPTGEGGEVLEVSTGPALIISI